MKNLIPFGLLMLVLGFAIGWLVKPVPAVNAATAAVVPSSHKSAEPVAANVPAEAPVPGKHAQREATVKKPSNMPTEAQMDQAKKMQADMSKARVKRQRDKFAQQIDRLTESLGLSADQKSKLTAWLDDGMKKLEGLDFTDPNSMSQLPELSKLLTNKALEEQLAPSLTSDQKAALVDFKDREHRGKVDTAALKSLSKLQGVIQFEDGQRDEVYKLLTEGAEASVLAESETPDMTKMFTEGMGIEMDPYDLGIQQAMTESMGDPTAMQEAPGDQKKMVQKLREVIDKRIDAKVELLRPVLNDKQLEQYRTELKTKGLGVYGSVLSGMEAGHGE